MARVVVEYAPTFVAGQLGSVNLRKLGLDVHRGRVATEEDLRNAGGFNGLTQLAGSHRSGSRKVHGLVSRSESGSITPKEERAAMPENDGRIGDGAHDDLEHTGLRGRVVAR